MAFLSVLVIFCTTYALILPAITLEKKEKKLVCPISIHQHTEECYQIVSTASGGTERVLTCGLADYVVHVHNEDCVDSDGNLVCTLPQIEAHHHSDACYEVHQVLVCSEMESEGHVHGPDCYIREQGELICEDTSEEHVHIDECYKWTDILNCGMEERQGAHQHTEGCYQTETTLICGKQELHTHSAACYDGNGALVCGLMELREHVHSTSCFADIEDRQQKLTEGEQPEVDKVIAMIDTLPTKAEADARVAEYGDDTDGAKGYLASLVQQGQAVYDAYSALPEDLQVLVTNRERLLAMKAWWDGEPVQPAKSIFKYADELGDMASVSLDIFDKNGKKVIADDNGNYNVTADVQYTVRLGFSSIGGMAPGYYYCTFPSGLNLNQSENLILEDNAGQEHTVGRWYFEGDRMIFYLPKMPDDLPEDDPERGSYISNYTKVSLFADVYITFEESNSPLEFDGNIKVNVHPNETPKKTEVSKWNDEKNSKETSIAWKAEIAGHKNSNIPGSILSDIIEDTSTHYYGESDMKNGIKIMACHYTDSSNSDTEYEECCWIIYPGAKGLTWSEPGWTYVIPASIDFSDSNLKLEWCVYKDENGKWQNKGGPFALGSENWIYYVEYTSTIIDDGSNGRVYYKNTIDIDGDSGTATVESKKGGDIAGDIVKTGNYNAEKNTFDWTITATIPGTKEEEQYNRGWDIYDEVAIDADTWVNYPFEEKNIVSVTATIGDKTYLVPECANANSQSDPFCWSADVETREDKWKYGRIYLYSLCKCTEATCPDWNTDNHQCETNVDGYCSCWCRNDKVIITVQYSMNAADIIKDYGGKGYKVANYAGLEKSEKQSNGKWEQETIDKDQPYLPIPGIFTKQVTDDNPEEFNNYTMEFEITVNEAMMDLSTAGPITIEDTMSQTLIFMKSTLIIKATDAQGNEKILSLDDGDYTVSYDSKEHKVTILLQEKALGPYMYTLTYRASVYIEAGTSASTYSNTASVKIFSYNYTAKIDDTQIPNAIASGETYSMNVKKVDADDMNKGLSGAEFGLYSADDTLIASGLMTDEDGFLTISTDVPKGILFYTHTLYYIRELKAPTGYQLDDTKYYFWFCNNKDTIACSKSSEFGLPPWEAKCIYTYQTEPTVDCIQILNKPIPDVYELPETGGSGTTMLYIGASVIMISAAAILYKKNKRRKDDAVSF